ncbi:hypothetical protein CKM354_000472700 [Cercospora kikuchii]|uniref:Uncharacterized protein n=1 Tax=Cercospora kikuchii TaxID=84275 RepID=A0A9P3CEQ0_9PEZI|nr:uncharacterized protein CKM354_000472700 [Cercospora kikuchii]GIZ41423.1 hypothetical protein CKM354_000472700 [Cercospora kikuchii]
MAPSRHVVLEIQNVQEFVQHILKSHAPSSTLVICSSKDDFLTAFREPPATTSRSMDGLDDWLQIPTLRLLSTSRTLKLAFCPDITHLRAYLAVYGVNVAKRAGETDTALRRKDAQPILAILNPLELHRPTSAFSAQGVNRTFANALEAAHSTNSKLILAEWQPQIEDFGGSHGQRQLNPWDEELPILNMTTKRLGDLSVGRTVKARTVAQRWCAFEQMPQPVRY